MYGKRITYPGPVEYSIEMALEKIENLLKQSYGLSKRSIGLLLLKEEKEIKDLVGENEPGIISQIEEITEETKAHHVNPIEYEVALRQKEEASSIASKVVRSRKERINFGERLSRLTMNPITGLPILFFVLYWGLYKFVGDFGAGTVVDFIEGTVFEGHINPFITKIFASIIPWEFMRDIFVGEYGVITLGFRYAVALILPIVTFFFLPG